MNLVETALLLLAAHALCDFPLQGEYLAKGKDGTNPANAEVWPLCMSAHALIHAGAVQLVTGRIELAMAELVMHWTIDCVKCEKRIGFVTDQVLHIACKLAYVAWIGLVAL